MTPDKSTTPVTEAGAIAALAEKATAPLLHQMEKLNVPIVIFPGNREIKPLEHLLDYPRRARAVVTVQDHQSFIEYVQRHRGAGTVIFCTVTEEGGSFTAILDYHRPNSGSTEIVSPQWGEHVCTYKCEFTPEWDRWIEKSDEMLSQEQMALFIEENMFDIADPEPAKMLELVKTLEATQGVEFRSALRLDNGDRQLHYAHTTNAKAGQQGDLEIPQRFRLKFAIFTNGPSYDINCRFRYNINGGQLRLGYQIEKPHKLIELALADARNAIIETVKLPVLLGSGSVKGA